MWTSFLLGACCLAIVQAQNVPQCLSLQGSAACPAFQDQSISPINLEGPYAFFQNVTDVPSFDSQLLNYVYNDYAVAKYGQELGCPNFNAASNYARWTLTYLCAIFAQTSESLTCSEANGVQARPLCTETCNEFTYSEATIVSSNATCGPDNSGGARDFWINQDILTCKNWTSIAQSDTSSSLCITGNENEVNCGFGTDAIALCNYCNPSNSNLNDLCCYSNSTDLSGCRYSQSVSAPISPSTSIAAVASGAFVMQRSAQTNVEASILASGFSALTAALNEYAITAGDSVVTGTFGTTTISSPTLITSPVGPCSTSMISASTFGTPSVSMGPNLASQTSAMPSSSIMMAPTSISGEGLSGGQIVGIAVGSLGVIGLTLVLLACICTHQRRRKEEYRQGQGSRDVVSEHEHFISDPRTEPLQGSNSMSDMGNSFVGSLYGHGHQNGSGRNTPMLPTMSDASSNAPIFRPRNVISGGYPEQVRHYDERRSSARDVLRPETSRRRSMDDSRRKQERRASAMSHRQSSRPVSQLSHRDLRPYSPFGTMPQRYSMAHSMTGYGRPMSPMYAPSLAVQGYSPRHQISEDSVWQHREPGPLHPEQAQTQADEPPLDNRASNIEPAQFADASIEGQSSSTGTSSLSQEPWSSSPAGPWTFHREATEQSDIVACTPVPLRKGSSDLEDSTPSSIVDPSSAAARYEVPRIQSFAPIAEPFHLEQPDMSADTPIISDVEAQQDTTIPAKPTETSVEEPLKSSYPEMASPLIADKSKEQQIAVDSNVHDSRHQSNGELHGSDALPQAKTETKKEAVKSSGKSAGKRSKKIAKVQEPVIPKRAANAYDIDDSEGAVSNTAGISRESIESPLASVQDPSTINSVGSPDSAKSKEERSITRIPLSPQQVALRESVDPAKPTSNYGSVSTPISELKSAQETHTQGMGNLFTTNKGFGKRAHGIHGMNPAPQGREKVSEVRETSMTPTAQFRPTESRSTKIVQDMPREMWQSQRWSGGPPSPLTSGSFTNPQVSMMGRGIGAPSSRPSSRLSLRPDYRAAPSQSRPASPFVNCGKAPSQKSLNSSKSVVSAFQDRFSDQLILVNTVVIVVHPYHGTLADELSLILGAEIIVRRMYDDGWAVGTLVDPQRPSESRDGAFPLICVTIKSSQESSQDSGESGKVGR